MNKYKNLMTYMVCYTFAFFFYCFILDKFSEVLHLDNKFEIAFNALLLVIFSIIYTIAKKVVVRIFELIGK